MGNRPVETPSRTRTGSLTLARTPSIMSTSTDDSADTPVLPEPSASPVPEPRRTTPPTRTDFIRNLVAESRGCNQLAIITSTHGVPTLVVDTEHSGIESLMEEINSQSKRDFNTYIHGEKLKAYIHEVLFWDNRVAFSIKDPDTDDDVIFRVYYR